MTTQSFIKQLFFTIFLAALAFGAPSLAKESGALSVGYLRCEYLVDPLGIDVALPRLSWTLTSDERSQKQTAYRIIAASSLKNLDAGTGDLWDTGKIESDDTAQIEYAGKPLESRMRVFWKVQAWDSQGKPSEWSAPAKWSMGLLKDSDWRAKWIGSDIPLTTKQKYMAQLAPLRTANSKSYLPAPFLRKDFKAAKKVRSAFVYATALGFFELYINGERIGKDYLTPGWTDFNKRVYYLTYDVTNQLKSGGDNAIGAILSDGWYAGNVGGRGQRIYGSQLRLRAQLQIEYEDGSEEIVASDDSWRANFGPILEADMQAGETYDARLEFPNWNKTGFDDSKWKKVTVTDGVKALVQAYPGIPVRKTKEIKPISVSEPKPGVFIFDMGQNFAGCERLKVKGNAGDKIVLRFGEMLNEDGTLYTTNLRSARVVDTYILKGGGEEVWEPSFTFHGYRYAEITGYPGKPDLSAITGIVMNSDLPETSSFATSQPLLNRLYSNILWGQRSNYLEVPTDCPQRDERLGWMGDAQVFVRAATYNMDVAPFFTKWLVDVEDGQRADGAFTDVAPAVSTGVSSAWGDAGVICPWTIYRVYGDKRVIEKHYKAMNNWIRFLEQRSSNYICGIGGYGDWLNVNSSTDGLLISTAYFGRSVRLLAEMSKAIGKDSEADKQMKLFKRIQKAFTMYEMSTDGKISGDTQTGYLLALHFDLIPDKYRKPAAEQLVGRIKDRDWSLSTGFVGCGLLLPTLTEIGRTDVAYRLIENRKYPSWGYSIDQGATTMWERWNSYTKEKGFGDPGMNSFNHYAYGSVGEWMFGTLAGIDTDGVGYKRLLIHPRPGGSLTWAKASYDSIRGKIETDWKFKGDDVLLDVTIPANTVATVYVPAKDEADVTEDKLPASKSTGVKFLRMEPGAAVYEVGSGKYSFASKGAKLITDAENVLKAN
ncbi:MAG: glycoside hydrolase family 78 protein [bacterium]